MTLAELLLELRRLLTLVGEEAVQEAELIAASVLGSDRGHLNLRRDESIPAQAVALSRALARRRGAGEPLAYVLGTQEFFGREFRVGPAVLIPRPETEHVVEEILRRGPAGWVVDVGTGSGAIAVTLALESATRGARLLATDRSEAALRVARDNARRLGAAGRICFCRADLLEAVVSRPVLAAVVANPPYVGSEEIDRLHRSVRDFEPREALVPPPGSDPASLRRRLVAQAARRLRPGGVLVLEVGAGQAGQARADLLAAGLRGVAIRNDLAGIGRVVAGVSPGGGAR